jgi:hypothetical protein
MHQYNIKASIKRIIIVTAGPFPESERGNRYLLIAMDYFTKWLKVYAMRQQPWQMP